MSLVAEGKHYLRDSMGVEELYDLENDPRELHDLKKTRDGSVALSRFRASILRVLTGDPATIGAAAVYLKRYTMLLESMVYRRSRSDSPGPPGPRSPMGPGGM
jgi:hypothetical protein